MNELQTLVPNEIKFLNLFELFHYAGDPGSWHQVASEFAHVRAAMGRRWTYDTVAADWKPDKEFVLQGPSTRYLVRAAQMSRLPRDAGLQCTNVTIEERRGGQKILYTAKEAVVDVSRGDTLAESGVRIELLDVRFSDGGTPVDRVKHVLDPLPVDAAIVQRAESLGLDAILTPSGTEPDGVLNERIAKASEMLGNITRRIRATIGERIAFSLSVLFLVSLGAVLGIVYRGAHIVVAFGISFIPALLVIVTIVTGRQLACNESTHAVGLGLTWSGLLLAALLDWYLLTRVLRR